MTIKIDIKLGNDSVIIGETSFRIPKRECGYLNKFLSVDTDRGMWFLRDKKSAMDFLIIFLGIYTEIYGGGVLETESAIVEVRKDDKE